MKEKLIELLGLKTDATDEQVIAGVSSLKSIAASRQTPEAAEKEITTLVTRSGGALNREGAKMVIRDRKAAAAKAKESKK